MRKKGGNWQIPPIMQRNTECPKMYRKYVLYLLKYTENLYWSRCSTDFRYMLGHSEVVTKFIYLVRYYIQWVTDYFLEMTVNSQMLTILGHSRVGRIFSSSPPPKKKHRIGPQSPKPPYFLETETNLLSRNNVKIQKKCPRSSYPFSHFI